MSTPAPCNSPLVPKGYVSTIEYAMRVGVAQWTVNRLARSGKVKAMKIPGLGNRIWICKDEADRALRPVPIGASKAKGASGARAAAAKSLID